MPNTPNDALLAEADVATVMLALADGGYQALAATLLREHITGGDGRCLACGWTQPCPTLRTITRLAARVRELEATLAAPPPGESVEGVIRQHHDLMPNWYVGIVVMPDSWPIGTRVRMTRTEEEK